jgi:hypothetical protein
MTLCPPGDCLPEKTTPTLQAGKGVVLGTVSKDHSGTVDIRQKMPLLILKELENQPNWRLLFFG